MQRTTVGIVTPALATANNGNWRTAARWARMLAPALEVRLMSRWQGEPVDLLIALHARRSADSIARWAAAHRDRTRKQPAPLVVVLTGTDLYRDIRQDATAQRSLRLADALVVLQDEGVAAVPPSLRPRTTVIYQSGARRRTLDKTRRHLRAVMVGHLRAEKSPTTLLAAARLLRTRPDIRIDLIGAPLDRQLAAQARAADRACAGLRWLGGLPHADTLRRIQRAHLLVHASAIEGGAHAILEAVCSGTPVLASRIPGNVGMLGDDYAGYFPLGDAPALARALERCRDDPKFLATLARQCRARASRFNPDAERRALRRLVSSLVKPA